MPGNIVLIGFMASGKSTVGRQVALRLGWEFVDTDLVVERAAGRSIPDIFASEGEAAFRDQESAAVLDVSAGVGQVIATGGGAPLREDNAEALRRAGPIVWLTARPDVVAQRVSRRTEQRPLLAAPVGEHPLTRILRLMGERAPCYQRLAQIVVDTSDRPPPAVAQEIIRRLGLVAP